MSEPTARRGRPRKAAEEPVDSLEAVSAVEDTPEPVIEHQAETQVPRKRTREELLAELAELAAEEADAIADGSVVLTGVSADKPNQHPSELLATPTLRTSAEVLANAKNRTIHVHFTEDGLTLLGKTWLRGEEIILEEGSPEWQDTLEGGSVTKEGERIGEGQFCLLELDEDEQVQRWGQRYFRSGPWRGLGITDAVFAMSFKEGGEPPTREELAAVETLRKRMLSGNGTNNAPATFGRRSPRTSPPPLIPASS